MSDFAAWLRYAMEGRGLTQARLAKKTGLARSTISMLLSDKNLPSPEACQALAKALVVEEIEVFFRAGLMSRKGDGSPCCEDRIVDLIEALSPAEYEEWIRYGSYLRIRENVR